MEANMSASTSHWQDRRVFVIGCTGFLGRAVTHELIRTGATAVGLIGERGQAKEFAREIAAGLVELVHGHVEDVYRLHSAMAVHEVSVVFNFVSSERGNSAVSYAVNRYHSRIPIVTVKPAFGLRVTEDIERPQNPLGIVRFEELFGPFDRELVHPVSRMAVTLLRGQPIPSGTNGVRDIVYVEDAARACLKVAEAVATEGQSLDLTFRSGWEFSDSTLATRIADVIAHRVVATPSDSPSNSLRWKPETTLNDALSKTVEWYREMLNREGGTFGSDDVRKAA